MKLIIPPQNHSPCVWLEQQQRNHSAKCYISTFKCKHVFVNTCTTKIKTHVIAAGAWQHLLVKIVSKLGKGHEISTNRQ